MKQCTFEKKKIMIISDNKRCKKIKWLFLLRIYLYWTVFNELITFGTIHEYLYRNASYKQLAT